ncbi:hypothetical protein BCV72DRAFT_301406 [Rhizopus microsporus var. microsporus]|uniref:Uncharacterized protein n=1 Tax=Rhizopus microsporus var. microsporus TaxID=86635 RepID=A0A1X0RFU0_RHIZD|nr:hypothetical protein BCV72DRAFT_301406 [Rhizopus microsporus var. microsporus]
MHFEGTVRADGVGVSIVKQKVDTPRKDAFSDRQRMETMDDPFVYLETLLTPEPLKNEYNSPEKKSTFRYTRNQRTVEAKLRRFHKLGQILISLRDRYTDQKDPRETLKKRMNKQQ